MNENEIIEAYLNGQKEGITQTETDVYIPMRITGLGISWRVDIGASVKALQTALKSEKDDINELIKECEPNGLQADNFIKYYAINRPKKLFNDLKVYEDLPITINHPKNEKNENSFLNYAKIKEAGVVGKILRAYLKGEAIWGIAKCAPKILPFLDKYQTTSPAVLSQEIETPLGVQEVPILANHLALVENGHWDSTHGDVGIDKKNLNKKGETMAVEDKVVTIGDLPKGDGGAQGVIEPTAKEQNEMAVLKAQGDAMQAETDAPQVAEVEAKKDEAEVEAKKDEAEVKEDAPEVKEDEAEVEAKKDEAVEVKHEVTPVKADEVVEVADANSDEIIDEVETEDDTERRKAIDEMREVCDENNSLLGGDLKTPYFNRRVNSSEAKRVFMSKNFAFVDSKFDGLVSDSNTTRGLNAKLNKQLIDEAFKSTIANIRAKAKASKGVVKERQWIVTDNPNIKSIPNF